jgi:hypothetical protein
MRNESVKPYTVDIYIGGPVEQICQILQDYVVENPFCFSVKPIEFIYHLGRESGAQITLINYARFPQEPPTLLRHEALVVGEHLLVKLGQGSFSAVGPDWSDWVSRRPQDG